WSHWQPPQRPATKSAQPGSRRAGPGSRRSSTRPRAKLACSPVSSTRTRSPGATRGTKTTLPVDVWATPSPPAASDSMESTTTAATADPADQRDAVAARRAEDLGGRALADGDLDGAGRADVREDAAHRRVGVGSRPRDGRAAGDGDGVIG